MKLVEEKPKAAVIGKKPEGWRNLAPKVQEEQDPNKMIALVQELIAKIDEEDHRKGLPSTSRIIEIASVRERLNPGSVLLNAKIRPFIPAGDVAS